MAHLQVNATSTAFDELCSRKLGRRTGTPRAARDCSSGQSRIADGLVHHAASICDHVQRFLANFWQTVVQGSPGMQEAGCWTRPGLLVCGGAPRRNRTGDPILTIRVAAHL
jgi:hypothetical protein